MPPPVQTKAGFLTQKMAPILGYQKWIPKWGPPILFYTFDPYFGLHFWYPKMGANFGAKKSQEACLRSGHGKELELEGIDQDRTNLKQDGWETFFTFTLYTTIPLHSRLLFHHVLWD